MKIRLNTYACLLTFSSASFLYLLLFTLPRGPIFFWRTQLLFELFSGLEENWHCYKSVLPGPLRRDGEENILLLLYITLLYFEMNKYHSDSEFLIVFSWFNELLRCLSIWKRGSFFRLQKNSPGYFVKFRKFLERNFYQTLKRPLRLTKVTMNNGWANLQYQASKKLQKSATSLVEKISSAMVFSCQNPAHFRESRLMRWT